VPGQELCILHSLEEEDGEAFLSELQKQISGTRAGETSNPAFDLSGYCFPLGICIGYEVDQSPTTRRA